MDRPGLDALYAMVVDDALGTLAPRVQAGLAGLMVVAALWAALRPRPLPVVGFLAAAFVFGRANHAFEGPVLVSFTPGHGLVLADLAPVALLGLVVVRALVVRGPRVRGSRVRSSGVQSGPVSDGSHPAPAAREAEPGGYRDTHGALRVRLRPSPIAAAAVPRGPARHRARRGR
ncbi:hypothetical protein [Kineosporia sp. R_H_3]|uniref:hypothetical protein n=1 Tax=Kineosporia sp. R_H_3 TaxID=1961848 RepID=UPI000B4C0EF0|nr:hypothetical protein [Kineosporia sp. R_H_3]